MTFLPFPPPKGNSSFSHLARLLGLSASRIDVSDLEDEDEDGDEGDEGEEGDTVEEVERADEDALMWNAQVCLRLPVFTATSLHGVTMPRLTNAIIRQR